MLAEMFKQMMEEKDASVLVETLAEFHEKVAQEIKTDNVLSDYEKATVGLDQPNNVIVPVNFRYSISSSNY